MSDEGHLSARRTDGNYQPVEVSGFPDAAVRAAKTQSTEVSIGEAPSWETKGIVVTRSHRVGSVEALLRRYVITPSIGTPCS